MLTERDLIAGLCEHWGLTEVRVTAHDGGMGSRTWFIEHGDRLRVAKAVAPGAGGQLAGGLAIAQRLERAGIPAGAPVPAADGRLVVDLGDAWLALLTWVPGRPLTGQSDSEQRVIGTTLGQVHAALAGHTSDTAQRFHWVDPRADHLSLRPWLRPAIAPVLDALDAAEPDRMRWGLLHADPAPGAFRLKAGRCGVIDWSYEIAGPLLYDLASALMFVGGLSTGRELTAAYLREGMLDPAEVARGLAAMLRFRWAVQANYFAWRIAENDLTGISGPQDNEKGLEDARRALLA